MKGSAFFCLLLAAMLVLPHLSQAEIVTRDLGKNSKGQTVSGFVFQPGRSYQRRPRRSDSIFGGRRDFARRGRGIDYGYSYPSYAPYFYYHVPYSYAYTYPLYGYHRGGGVLSVHVRF